MTKPSLILVLTLSVGFGVGCARDDVAGPRADVAGPQASVPVFARMEVAPRNIALFPGSTTQLSIKAWDQFGAPMLEPVDGNGDGAWASKASYTSSDPQVTKVSGRGVVTGVAHGSAEITATLTLGGITQTASTSTTVSALVSFPAGVYDLTARIIYFDPIWEDLTDHRYTAILTFPAGGNGATWESFRLVDAAGEPSNWTRSGIIKTYSDFAGRLVIELVADYFHLVLVQPVQDPLDSRLMTGTWGCCGHIGGTFTAMRRQ